MMGMQGTRSGLSHVMFAMARTSFIVASFFSESCLI